MVAPSSSKPTLEQLRLREQLVKEYGAPVVEQAWHLGGLAMCMVAMAHDELTSEERASAYQTASGHLSGLLEPLMPPGHASKVNECAKRLDSAVSLWMLDDIEARQGFPKGPANDA
jgi:hypothetical protein